MQITIKKLSELKRNPKNIRKHSQKQIEEYVRSIKMFGQTRPMVIDETGLILAGNGLYDALKTMNVESCDCYIITGLSERQKDKLMLADNKVFELGISDLDTIEEVVRGLGDDLDVPGYDDEVLKIITATVKEATNEVVNYGNVEPINENTECKPAPCWGETMQEVSQKQEIPYANVTETTPSAIGTTSNETGKYIICPKCGEKIWL